MTVEPPTRSAPRVRHGRSNNTSLANQTILLIWLNVKKCKKQYIGETKRSLRQRFTEHRQATNNSDHASASAAVPTHFNLPSHSVKSMLLIPLELRVSTNNPSRRKAREAYFIQRGQRLAPYGRSTDELNANFGLFIYCNFSVPYIIYYYHSITLFITLC